MKPEKSAAELRSLAQEKEFQATLGAIETVYKGFSTESPDSEIDRQILAAAQREMMQPVPKENIKNSIWRRWSLPLYATATIAFTAIGTQWLLPPPARVPPGTSSGPVVIDVIHEADDNHKTVVRHSIVAPPQQTPETLPSLPITQPEVADKTIQMAKATSEEMKPEPFEYELQDSPASIEHQHLDNNLNATSSGQSSLDKEQWARKIIDLLRNGDNQLAQRELIEFKKAFPGYPIDEQIEVLK